MKLVLTAVSSNTQISGITRHAANVARCLLLHTAIEEIHLIVAPWEQQMLRSAIACEHPRLHVHSVFVDRASSARNLWFYTELPLVADQLGADLLHLSYPAPLNRRRLRCPAVVSVHDLYPYDVPQNWGYPKVVFNRMILRQCLGAADALACVSGATLGRVRERFSGPIAAKAQRIYNSVEPAKVRSCRGPLPASLHAPFLLCVAQHRRNKNLVLALRAFRRLLGHKVVPEDMLLVIVGMAGPETPALQRAVEEAGIRNNVLFLGGISDAELQWCYRNCELLIAPSLIEGFGLPLAEGLLAGCRIVCSEIPAHRELAGDACRYFQLGPEEEAAFAAQIAAAMADRRPQPTALPQLAPATIAGEYLALYEKLAQRREQRATTLQPVPGILAQR
jgi:glycosyltransferase involved in cell wall biosynthesis